MANDLLPHLPIDGWFLSIFFLSPEVKWLFLCPAQNERDVQVARKENEIFSLPTILAKHARNVRWFFENPFFTSLCSHVTNKGFSTTKTCTARSLSTCRKTSFVLSKGQIIIRICQEMGKNQFSSQEESKQPHFASVINLRNLGQADKASGFRHLSALTFCGVHTHLRRKLYFFPASNDFLSKW